MAANYPSPDTLDAIRKECPKSCSHSQITPGNLMAGAKYIHGIFHFTNCTGTRIFERRITPTRRARLTRYVLLPASGSATGDKACPVIILQRKT